MAYTQVRGHIRKGRPVRPHGRLVTHRDQRKTYWLKDNDTGEFEGRDADSKHPKGTYGRKDDTLVQQDKKGRVFGRTDERGF
jgi:hypothetical protein